MYPFNFYLLIKIVYESTSHTIVSPFYSSKEEHLNEIYQENAPCNFPIFKGNKYLENFISIHITKHEHIKGTIIIGLLLIQKYQMKWRLNL